jgi:hypothetical protein
VGFLAITVSDLGAGIHGTLLPREGESDFDRLIRAFRVGESSMPEGADIERGKGLDSILEACETTKALLLVFSRDLCAFFDATVQNRAQRSLLSRYQQWEGLKQCGTSLSLVLPVFGHVPKANEAAKQGEMLLQ